MNETPIHDDGAWEIPARPASWGELALAFASGWILGAGLALVFVGNAFAGGPVALTWNQASDCASVTGWELLVAPITTANPNPQPTNAVVGVSFANTGMPPCGLTMTRTVNLSGVGASRFWLRAVAGTVRSAESNEVSTSLPLAAPSGLLAVPQ